MSERRRAQAESAIEKRERRLRRVMGEVLAELMVAKSHAWTVAERLAEMGVRDPTLVHARSADEHVGLAILAVRDWLECGDWGGDPPPGQRRLLVPTPDDATRLPRPEGPSASGGEGCRPRRLP